MKLRDSLAENKSIRMPGRSKYLAGSGENRR